MQDFGRWGTMLLAGSGFLIAIYLVVTNPAGDKVILGSGSGAYNSGVRALQGR
jgi:hypothetical protein